MTTTLSNHDFIVAIDFSGSMGSIDAGHSKTRIQRAKESVIGLVSELSQVDADGIDLITFQGSEVIHTAGVKDTTGVEAVFNRRASGGTPTAEALTKAFQVAGKSDKPDFIVVITDGIPDNEDSLRNVIINQANSQDTDEELTVLFIQIGNDPDATKFLTDLDDNLKGAKFDIVDVKTQAEADAFPTLQALIEAAIAG